MNSGEQICVQPSTTQLLLHCTRRLLHVCPSAASHDSCSLTRSVFSFSLGLISCVCVCVSGRGGCISGSAQVHLGFTLQPPTDFDPLHVHTPHCLLSHPPALTWPPRAQASILARTTNHHCRHPLPFNPTYSSKRDLPHPSSWPTLVSLPPQPIYSSTRPQIFTWKTALFRALLKPSPCSSGRAACLVQRHNRPDLGQCRPQHHLRQADS